MKFFLIFLSVCVGYAQEYKQLLRVAPLPTNSSSQVVEELSPLFDYIDKISKIKTQYIYEKDYENIIKKFKNNEIDIAILGPLPYLKLRQNTQNCKPIILFKNKKNDPYYRCVLAKFKDDSIDFNLQLKIALTQPFSTCGYYMTQKLLKNHYNLDLEKQKYHYRMSHSVALTSILEGDFHLAGVKESIAEDFSSLGIEVIAKSEFVPEFALVVNTQTLSKKQIEVISNIILSIPESTYNQWKGLLSNGFLKTDAIVYEKIQVNLEDIPQIGNMK